jgi:predicted transcriptional regulator
MEGSIEQMFVKEKPVKLLAELKSEETENYATDLEDAINTTSAHAINLIKRFRENGLITAEKEGRKKHLQLTDEGEELAEQAQKFDAALQNYEQGGA